MFNSLSSSQFRNHAPLFWIGQMPVYLVTALISVHCAFMALTALLLASQHGAWINLLVYNSTAVAHGEVWRLLTYAFISPPSLWFALEMLMLYYFGSVVEKNIGCKNFACLYGGLILWGAAILQLVSLITVPQGASGAQSINMAIFAAFIAIYPGAQFLFGLTGRTILVALLAIASLQLIADHEITTMIVFVTSAIASLIFMKKKGYGEFFWGWSALSFSKFFHRSSAPLPKKPTLVHPTKSSSPLIASLSTTTSFVPVAKKPPRAKTRTKVSKTPFVDIDLLLEKISSTGMASLTEQEKKELEKARTALLQRDKKS